MERAILRKALSQAVSVDRFGPLAEALGFDAVAHPINYLADASGELARRLTPLAGSLLRIGAFGSQPGRAGLWVASLPEWDDRKGNRERARRRLARALVELAPAGDRNVLLVVTAEGIDDLEIVLPRRRSDGSLGTVRALVGRSDPTRHHLELLESLVLTPGDETAAITRRWSDAFDVEKVTKSFYLEFRTLRNRIVEVLAGENPTNPLLAVGDDEAAKSDLRRFVTRNLGRVLFLWFIQSKGWLDGDAHYLLNLYNTRCRGAGDHNFFRESLIPLFFDAIAKKPEDRPDPARALGDLPYLNGGLFIQTAFEDRLYGENRERVDVVMPNDLFDARVHDPKTPTVLGLLSSYRFTTRESTPDDQSLDPDPELLGKVFENLNEERKKTGTYYTPREVVRFMCRETLDGYLRDVAGVSDETLDALRLKALDPAATDVRLSAANRTRLETALLKVKVCDPAVGSGAFPVGMLQEIVQLLIGIEQSADVSVSVGGQRVAEWKEKIITGCLYGVDINPEAVEICHLRLWLSMVIDADRPVPLPNLDFRFEAGDSLVDRIWGLRLPDSLPAETQLTLAMGEASAAIAKLEKLRADYTLAKDPVEARELRAAIKEAQLDVVRVQLHDLVKELRIAVKERRGRLRELEHRHAPAAETRKSQGQIEEIVNEIGALEQFGKHLASDAPYKKPFLWPVEFPEVFEEGGFDIVVANPPYVRQEDLAPEDQKAYAAGFPEVYTGTADLLVYFYARAIQIMRESGHLAFITSNKFHRAAYGEGLREYLPRVLAIEHVIDFGDLAVFDAIAYPSILVGVKRDPSADRETRVARLTQVVRHELAQAGVSESVATVREQLEGLDGLLQRNAIADFPQVLLRRDGWVLEDPRLVRLFDRLMGTGTPLGKFVQGRMYYGIKTGLNNAFVIDEGRRAELIAADPRSEDLIKPWLRGKDIKRWHPAWAKLCVIAIQNSGDAGNANPWQQATTERQARTVFKKAYPAVHDYISEFEDRLRPRADQGRWWWELRACTYYAEFEQPKIIFNRFIRAPEFAWDVSGSYHNDACYMVAGVEPWLLGIMNSAASWFVLRRLCSDLQGGYLQVFVQFLERLPVPPLARSDAEHLSSLVQRVGDLTERAALEAEIEQVVCGAFGLLADDAKILEEWVTADLASTLPVGRRNE